jgi:hypothetical protein
VAFLLSSASHEYPCSSRVLFLYYFRVQSDYILFYSLHTKGMTMLGEINKGCSNKLDPLFWWAVNRKEKVCNIME